MLLSTHYCFLEKGAITVSPSSQEVRNGDTAVFQCSAKGTNVSVTWIFNGSTCNPDNCELNATTAYQNANDFQINATLEIETELLPELLPVTAYALQCIAEQNLDSLLMSNTILVATFNLIIIFVSELGKH